MRILSYWESMKTDCIKIDDCPLSARFCNDSCDEYEIETHPFAIKENRDCSEYHMKQDMGEI